ncbi:MAG: rhodanese-like domain-containing protein [Candidatus Thiodiazotropha lotti]|nr:rhodanese-like domain-containing protein [Candidatus Thiodiazotropha lotti]
MSHIRKYFTLDRKQFYLILAGLNAIFNCIAADALEYTNDLNRSRIHFDASNCLSSDVKTSDEVSVSRNSLDKLDTSTKWQESGLVFTCLQSVDNIYSEWNKGTILLVDVRNTKIHNQNKIPNSINIPLYSVKGKKNLQNRNLVLYNNGAKLSSLENACSALKANGFKKISVMQDGLNAWKDAGYSISGDRLSIQRISDLTPSEVISILTERDWLFVDLDHSSNELPNLLSSSNVIDYTEDIELLREKIDAFKAAKKSGTITGFLVISKNGNSNGIIKRRLLDSGIKDVYYLTGGVKGLNRYIQSHSIQIDRLRKGFQVRMGCNG